MQFSVVIPSYNKRNTLRECIESVLNQSYSDFELLIVDDGSSDDSLEVARGFSDKRIRVIEKENGGVSSARNLGIKLSKNPWIAFLDGDDVWERNHLQTIVDLAKCEPLAMVFSTSFERFSSKESIVEKFLSFKREFNHYIVEDLFECWLRRMGVICSSSAVVHKSCFAKVGLFNQGLVRGEDTDLWIRLFRCFSIARTDVVTVLYRVDSVDGNASVRKNCVRKFEVFYFKPNWFKWSWESRYYFHVIWGHLKMFVARKEWRNLLLLVSRYHFGLVVILFERLARIFQGRTT